VIALIFGSGWTLGDRTQLSALADHLASAGMVVINGEHRTLLHGARIPDMLEEVACLAAAAPYWAESHLTGGAGPVWLLGFSSGAHLAAVTALGDAPLPNECPYASTEIAGVIGLAGPYDLDRLWNEGILTQMLDSEVPTEYLPQVATFLQEQSRAAMQFFLRFVTGASPDTPELWYPLNPIHLAHIGPERSFLLITGSEDQVISPIHSIRLAEALTAEGHRVRSHTLTNADHFALTDPQNVGDVILPFLTGELHFPSQ